VGAGAARAAPASPPARRPTLVVYDFGPGAAASAGGEIGAALARTGRFALRYRAEVIAALRADPQTALAGERAAAAVEEGRGHETRLDWRGAEASYRRALLLLDERLARLHSPEAVARIHLALGALAVNEGRRPAALDEFRRALQLAPQLRPDRSYSPQVRQTFAQTRRPAANEPRPAAPPPTPAELGRLCAAVHADAVLLLEDDDGAGRRVLRGSVFIGAREAYVAVETRALAPGAAPAPADVEVLAARLLQTLDDIYPPPRRPASQPATSPLGPPPPPPPPPPPVTRWWRSWWLWAAVGVVAAGSVSVPLLLRRDTVDLVLRY
jgi:tetratricopeptide (TPR) repeat protein